MYPERIGQARRGPIDWKVAGLDGLFLLLFFLPGVIAFAIDWWNGTLFLPNGCYSNNDEVPGEPFRRVELGPKPTLKQIAAAIHRETGQEIDLESGEYYTEEISSLNEFDLAHTRLLAQHESGELIYRCQSKD
ncbi:MAG: hypothetical protein KDA80_04050 [Planctomycetaceae bacterium]|nr:hypothetical protein [Planctomycetaceae bacterium]